MIDDIPGNAAAFAASLNQLAGYMTSNVEKVIRKTCIDLYKTLVIKTPRDTGRAAASWGISTRDTTLAAEPPKEGWPEDVRDQKIDEFVGKELQGFSFDIHDDKVTIYNNLEYIPVLEGGSSRQAPSGMVSVSLLEFTSHFNKAIADIEGLNPT